MSGTNVLPFSRKCFSRFSHMTFTLARQCYSLWLVLFTVLALPVMASTYHPLNLPADVFKDDREQYLAIEKKLRTYSRRRIDDLDGEIYALGHYPLYPYLLRLKIERTMSLKTKREIKQFLEDYSEQPVSYGLRYQWLNYLARHGYQQTFLEDYRPGMGAKLTCISLNYRLNQGENAARVLSEVDALWLHGQSQPDECDPLFAKWKKSGADDLR